MQTPLTIPIVGSKESDITILQVASQAEGLGLSPMNYSENFTHHPSIFRVASNNSQQLHKDLTSRSTRKSFVRDKMLPGELSMSHRNSSRGLKPSLKGASPHGSPFLRGSKNLPLDTLPHSDSRQSFRRSKLLSNASLYKNGTILKKGKHHDSSRRDVQRHRSRMGTTTSESHSYSLSALLKIQDMYLNRPVSMNNDNSLTPMSAFKERAMFMAERIKRSYYFMLKRDMKRRMSVEDPKDPEEFNIQQEKVEQNAWVPIKERIKNLEIAEKTALERNRDYKDSFPLLKLRKRFLKTLNLISLFSLKIITHSVFDYFILIVILTNSVFLALDDPTSDGAIVSPVIDNIFLGIYTVEMLLKIAGMGFLFNRNAYLREMWNLMDFTIVITAYIPLIFQSNSVNLQAFRSLRVLRPLRTISNVEALRVLIITLLAALKPLAETLLILFFLFMVFAIAGLQLFSGVMKKRCFSVDMGIPLTDLNEPTSGFQMYCNSDDDCATASGVQYICGKMIANPNHDVTNFDTIANSFLMVFQSVTMEGWSDIMIIIEKTFSPLAALYFVFLIFLGAFFLLNLTLAVIKAEFSSNSHKPITTKKKHADKTYYEKLSEKLEKHKYDIIKLIKKRMKGEISYNKFQLKGDKLTAIDVDKNHPTNKRRRNHRKSILVTKVDHLRRTVFGIVGFFGKPARSQGGRRAAVMARLSQTSGDPNADKRPLAKVKPEVKIQTNIQMSFSNGNNPKDLQDAINLSYVPNISSQISPDSSTAFLANEIKNPSLLSPRIGFLSPNSAPRSDMNGNTKLSDLSPLHDSPTPRKDSHMLNSVGKGNVGFQINIIESKDSTLPEISPASRNNNEFRHSLKVPNIIEEGNHSEEESSARDNLSSAKNETLFSSSRNQSNRPLKGQFIDIVGIRGNRAVLYPKRTKLNDRFDESTPTSAKAAQFEDIQGFFDAIKNNETNIEQKQEKRKSVRLTLIEKKTLKKMNHIIKLRKQSKNDLSQSKQISMDLSEDYDAPSVQNPTGLLDDSDFGGTGNEKGNRRITDRSIVARGLQKKTTRRFSRTTTFRPTQHPRPSQLDSETRRLNQENDEEKINIEAEKEKKAEEEDEEEDYTDEEESFVIDLRKIKAEPKQNIDYEAGSLHDVMPSIRENQRKKKEEEEIRRLRETKLKLEYKITKADEAKAEQRKNLQQKESWDWANGMPWNNKNISRTATKEKKDLGSGSIESYDKKSTLDRNISLHRGSSIMKTMDTKNESKNEILSKKQAELKMLATKKRRTYFNNASNEDYLDPAKMKDYNAVLTRLMKPFENEKEEIEAEYENVLAKNDDQKHLEPSDEAEYNEIRRRDLEIDKIVEMNWSGDNVLRISNKTFATDRVKKSLNNPDYDIWRPGVLGLIHALRRKTRTLVEMDLFNNFIMLIVLLNTIILASDGMVTDSSTLSLFSTFNLIFTAIFTVEMGLKIFAFGIIGYTTDTINLLDAGIVVLSLSEQIFISEGTKAVSAFRTIRLLRTFRVLRVTKLLRSLSFMKVIIGVISRSIKKFVYILLLLFLLIFIYSLLGMQIYGGTFNFSYNVGDDRQRQNFDTFLHAFMAVFQIMSQENWNDIMVLALESSVNKVISILYFVSWIFIGNYIFLNLFLAILLDEFTGEETEEEFHDIEEEKEEAHVPEPKEKTIIKKPTKARSTMVSSRMSVPEHDDEEDKENETKLIMYKDIMCEKVAWVLPKGNKFRDFCYKIAKSSYFDKGILVLIILSSIKLTLDTYISDDNTELNNVSEIVDNVFNALFWFEALVKIISFGFVVDKGSYLREYWNILDFIIVVASLLDVAISSVDISFIRVLRLLRTLRPLRFISHNENMRLVVTALIESIGAIFNVLIVLVLVWLMFAILAVNIIGGKMGYCTNLPSGVSRYGISQTSCISQGYTWTTPNVNFDNVFQGMLSVFIISTQENWPDILFTVIDANDSEVGPIEEGNQAFGYAYFIIFIFIVSYFLFNLFVGVIFMHFTNAQKNEDKLSKFLSPKQQKWIAIQRLIILNKPDVSNVEPKANWMKKFFRVINSTPFDLFIIVCIVLNIIAMALTYEGSSDTLNKALQYINWFFSSIFFIEMILKHLGLGLKRYWSSNWNKFDAFVVIASILDITFDLLEQSFLKFIKIGPQLARVLRVLRVSRLLKLVKKFQGLQKIINTLIFSLPSLLNVGALLSLVYFIYAVLATFLFQTVSRGNLVNEYVNFSNFSNAIITLFRASTGESWYILMFDTMYPRGCSNGGTNCGSIAGSIIFWLSFMVICQFIFLNLFILVILQQFEEYHLNPNNPVQKFRLCLEDIFKPAWEKYALKYGGKMIHETQLMPFFQSMGPPIGYKNEKSKAFVAKEIMQMKLVPNHKRMLHYYDVLYAAMKHGFGKHDMIEQGYEYMLQEELKTMNKIEQLKKQTQRNLRKLASIAPTGGNKANSVNPIVRILFVGMTMRAWLKYSHYKTEKLKAARENGIDYVSSQTEEESYDSESESQSDSESRSEEDKYGEENYSKEEDEVEKHDDEEEEHDINEKSRLVYDPKLGILKRVKKRSPTSLQEAWKAKPGSTTNLSPVRKSYSRAKTMAIIKPNDHEKKEWFKFFKKPRGSANKDSGVGDAKRSENFDAPLQSNDDEDPFDGHIINYNIQNNVIINNNFYIKSPTNREAGEYNSKSFKQVN